VVGKPTILV